MIHTIASALYNRYLSLISPPFCAGCNLILTDRFVLCDRCKRLVRPVATTSIPVTKKYSVKLFAASGYAEPLKSLVLAKSHGNRTAAGLLGQLAWQMTDVRNASFDYIVPVPLHWLRFARRGYNQAAEMARVIAKESEQPLLHAVKRTAHRPFQSQIARELRSGNVCGAFSLRKKYKDQIRDKHILIIDDLVTTGATLRATARELIRARPASLTALVACRAS